MRFLQLFCAAVLSMALMLLCSCTLFGAPTDVTTPTNENVTITVPEGTTLAETTPEETTPEETTPEETTPEETTPAVTEPDFSNTPDPDGTKRY